jgi:hypothetical protein
MLTAILAITHCAPDLAAVEAAYCTYFQYRAVARAPVSAELARLWNAPRMAGRESLLLQPASGEPVFLRFVEAEAVPGYAPMRTAGWNATEILAASPDEMAARLDNSPFRIIGPPRGLSSNPAIRAMQVIGPANELLYLTSIPPGESAFGLESAKTEVDRAFIVVAGGRDLTALREWYASRLGLAVSAPVGVRISVLSNAYGAYGMDAEQLHDLAVVRLPGRCLIELDQYPREAQPRPRREGELPPGMAAVSFEADSHGGHESCPIPDAPYAGRRVALLTGAAGELIELVV